MKKTNYFLHIRFLNFIFFLFLIPQFSYARFIVPEIEIVAKDTVVGTLDCYAYDIVLEAYIQNVCAAGETKWTYLLINSDNGDTLQYSHNYLPLPGEGIAGDENFDILSEIISARMKVTKPLGIGNYKLIWNMINECGDSGTKVQNIKVIDKTPPVPVLADHINAILVNGVYEVKAKEADKGNYTTGLLESHDNCSTKNELYYTFTPMIPNLWVNANKWNQQFAQYGKYFFDPVTGAISTEAKFFTGNAHAWYPQSKTSSLLFGCDYVEYSYLGKFKIYVWDKFELPELYGDLNYAFDTCYVSSSGLDCPGDVIGNVFSFDKNIPIKDFKIRAFIDQHEEFKLTDTNGFYRIQDPFNNMQIEAYKDNNFLNGVTTYDILLIHKHILGLKKFDKPYQIIAADVNDSKGVTSADILEIRNVILGKKDRFVGKSWIGILMNYVFKKPLEPFEELSKAKIANPGNYFFGDYRIDFYGVKIGDVNYNSLPNRSITALKLILDESPLKINHKIEIPIYAKDFKEVKGLQFTIDMSGFSDFSIESGELKIDEKDYNIKDNKFIFSYVNENELNIEDGKVLFYFEIETTQSAQLSSILRFAEYSLSPEAYLGEETEIADLELEFRDSEFNVYQNEPNPFFYKTSIGFNLTDQTDYKLSIYDLTGKTIYSVQSIGKIGYNKIELNPGIFIAKGLYLYRIESGVHSVIKKMIYSK